MTANQQSSQPKSSQLSQLTVQQPDQQAAPLLQALQAVSQQSRAIFHTPGHQQGKGAPAALHDLLDRALQADLPELPELDNLFAPERVIQAAQDLAAAAFGAEQTWFLANGSTCGLEAAILATCNPGDKLILPRNAHQSVFSALVLSGALPVWVEPDTEPIWEIALGLKPEQIQAALAAHPDAKAVLLVSPTYHGICSDIQPIAALVHQHNLPLLVDEAHGAHLAFHPDLPASALSSGADLTVQSSHKTLSALTQAAMLHVQGTRINRHRLSQALRLVQSTSPNYLLLASLDAARQQMATQGKPLLSRALEQAHQARTQISQIPGLKVLESNQLASFSLDPLRLTLSVANLGITGFSADEILHHRLKVTAELPALHQLTFILTPSNTPADIQQLIQACQTLADQHPVVSKDYPMPPLPKHPFHSPALSPRAAFFAPRHTLPIAEAIHQISADLICPYPPGIPVLFPGETITPEAVQTLQQVLTSGGILTGCADPTLNTLTIITP